MTIIASLLRNAQLPDSPTARLDAELLLAAALVSALVPVAHGAMTGWWFWVSAAAGHGALFAIDIGALAMAVGFLWLAWMATLRARHGERNSVWAVQAHPPG